MTLQRGTTIAAAVWAIGVALVLLFGPVYSTASDSTTPDPLGGPPVVVSTTGHQTALAVNGPGIVLMLALPVLLAVAPLMTPARPRATRIVSAGLMLVFCALGALSVGLFFVPSAILLLIGAAMKPRPSPKSPDGARAPVSVP